MNTSFDILNYITTIRDSFSKQEEILAGYILKNPTIVISLSITQLAHKSKTSISTVSRFCKKLSLDGYPELKHQLIKSLTNNDPSGKEWEKDISGRDSIPDMISKMTTMYQQAIETTAKNIDPVAFKKVSDLIESSSNVYFVGVGDMYPVALAARIQFMTVSGKFHCDIDSTIQSLSTIFMDEKSLVIIFAFTGETIGPVEVARFAKQRKAKVVAITRYSKSKLTELADYVIICGVSKSYKQYSSLPLATGFQFIVDMLYTEYCRRNPKKVSKNKEKAFGTVFGRSEKT